MAIRSNYKLLQANLEIHTGQKITYDLVSAETKIPKATLVRFANNDTSSVSYSVLESLLDFFNKRGMNITLDDLLVKVEDCELAA